MVEPVRKRSPDRPVLDAFPEHRERLIVLFGAHPDLDELCDDYDVVAQAYSRATSGDAALAGSADEYHRLKVELEGEILEWIGRAP